MSEPVPMPTLRGRVLGGKLRDLREATGMSVEAVATRLGIVGVRVQRLEDGVTPVWMPDLHAYFHALRIERRLRDVLIGEAVRARDLYLECDWGPEAESVLTLLGRTAERVDVLSPHAVPTLHVDDLTRCTVFTSEGAMPSPPPGITVRWIPFAKGAYPGIGHPCTLFHMAEGPSVVYLEHVHAATFIEEPDEVMAARSVFERLDVFLD
ncbi:Scr1 family TA system antitoxin-like transcriptional regulator [Umezawaea sp. Da 62-37]|uniref:Scr1 family TA system antitoxin-like transcriptional regulator n=1 Tax=Umezawaea sp. Da 62-37 TaxID=3075927 RepID=UPI0028F73EF4|nr:Scr1 family TA system antitoxin-like transcriptional regulator [Umezawaea sp. Da 62-37]WNV91960.1 Scr1 family TA system antitoxin-like transcriptional regulator [Umezawaea sp. Da 62-37]